MQQACISLGNKTNAVRALATSFFVMPVLGCMMESSPPLGTEPIPDGEGTAAPMDPVLDETGAASDALDLESRASRVFAGPDQYPPEEFAAYGILAFQSEVTDDSRDRYQAICQGFLATLTAAIPLSEEAIPLEQQMATLWPLVDAGLADELNTHGAGTSLSGRCEDIVDNIDIGRSLRALEAARMASPDADLGAAGPYLLAWSPSNTFGQSNVPVLRLDLSRVTTADGATGRFIEWRTKIQFDPGLWRNGWNLEGLRTLLQDWANRYGPEFCVLFGSRRECGLDVG